MPIQKHEFKEKYSTVNNGTEEKQEQKQQHNNGGKCFIRYFYDRRW